MSFKYVAHKEEKIGPVTCLVEVDGKEEELENYGFHSPDGFQIGYAGSGPADLAYSVLTDYYIRIGIDEMKARRYALDTYQDFKREFIVPATSYFFVSDYTIMNWLKSEKEVEI